MFTAWALVSQPPSDKNSKAGGPCSNRGQCIMGKDAVDFSFSSQKNHGVGANKSWSVTIHSQLVTTFMYASPIVASLTALTPCTPAHRRWSASLRTGTWVASLQLVTN
jgi:hypothetical protein